MFAKELWNNSAARPLSEPACRCSVGPLVCPAINASADTVAAGADCPEQGAKRVPFEIIVECKDVINAFDLNRMRCIQYQQVAGTWALGHDRHQNTFGLNHLNRCRD